MVNGGRGGNTFSLGSYKESTNRIIDLIYDASVNYQRPINDDFKIGSTLGFQSIDQANRFVAGTTVGGLVIPRSPITSPTRLKAQEQQRSLPSIGSWALISILLWVIKTGFLENTLHVRTILLRFQRAKEVSLTEGGGISVVPTNLESVDLGPLNYMKFRAGIGTAGKDAPQYRLDSYYGLNPLLLDLGDDYQIRFPFKWHPEALSGQSALATET